MNIKCEKCRFVQRESKVKNIGYGSDIPAFECGNPESEYYKAIVNMDSEGALKEKIEWPGCECGEKRSANQEQYHHEHGYVEMSCLLTTKTVTSAASMLSRYKSELVGSSGLDSNIYDAGSPASYLQEHLLRVG